MEEDLLSLSKILLDFGINPQNLDCKNSTKYYDIIINALKDLVKRFPKFADLPKIYGGGSYGGYLALLIAKIAPWMWMA